MRRALVAFFAALLVLGASTTAHAMQPPPTCIRECEPWPRCLRECVPPLPNPGPCHPLFDAFFC